MIRRNGARNTGSDRREKRETDREGGTEASRALEERGGEMNLNFNYNKETVLLIIASSAAREHFVK